MLVSKASGGFMCAKYVYDGIKHAFHIEVLKIILKWKSVVKVQVESENKV